jgi:hypothetical protein
MLYSVARKGGVTRETYRAMVGIINNNIIPAAGNTTCTSGTIKLSNAFSIVSDPTFKVRSEYKSKQAIKAAHPVKFDHYASCPNGCMMFEDDDDLATCRHCTTARPSVSPSSGIPASYVSVASVSDIVAAKLYHPLSRSQLLHRSIRQTEVDKMTDIFDGAMYKAMVERGFFDSPYDVAITLGIDGFVPFNKGLFTATIVNMTIMNIDPKDR